MLKAGEPTVTVRGLPSEVTLFVFGREPQADVELLGDDAGVARLSGPLPRDLTRTVTRSGRCGPARLMAR